MALGIVVYICLFVNFFHCTLINYVSGAHSIKHIIMYCSGSSGCWSHYTVMYILKVYLSI